MLRGLVLALLCVLALPADVVAQSPPPAKTPDAGAVAGGLTPDEAQHAIAVLQDPKRRAELIATLQAIAKAQPATEGKPGEPHSPANKPEKPPAVSLAPHSLGAQLMFQISRWPERLALSAAAAAQALTGLPLLLDWARQLAGDPGERLAVLTALWQLAVIVIAALLLEWVARRVLARPTTALENHAGDSEKSGNGAPGRRHDGGAWPLLRRLPFALARLGLELVPVGVFWAAGSLLAGLVAATSALAAIIVVVNAYATGRLVMAVGRMLVSPENGRMRLLLQVGDEQARYLIRWLRRITGVAIIGVGLANLALLFGLYQDAYETLIRAVGLVIGVMLAILVLRGRQGVASRLHAAADATDGFARWRNWLAGVWHYLALLAIVAGWILWVAGIEGGLGGLRLLIGTIAILVGARLLAIVALGMLDRGMRLSAALPDAGARTARYTAAARAMVRALLLVATAVVLLQIWGANAFLWFGPGHIGAKLVSAAITIAIATLAAILIWEIANAFLEGRLARLSAAGSAAHSARLRTLLPILRATLAATVLAIVGLTALSQVGVNIAPLLAGAGIAGVAVGFGAQKLVQDVITGMFVLFENAIQIGDWVTVSGLSGSVERLSVRNIWLRGGDGAVHIIPFSAVTSITNTNRGLGNAAVAVTVPFEEDSDRVAGVLSEIAAEMRRDNDFASLMLGDLQIWVDAVKVTGVTLAGLIACTDSGRWPVQHEFNRRLQRRFRELGIDLAYG